MRWASHVVRMGRGEVYSVFEWGVPRERAHLENPGLDRRIILRLIFRKWVGALTGSMAQDRDRW